LKFVRSALQFDGLRPANALFCLFASIDQFLTSASKREDERFVRHDALSEV